ncbi:hypothetical protein LCGC14_2150370, partial [marine sediment metagenome]
VVKAGRSLSQFFRPPEQYLSTAVRKGADPTTLKSLHQIEDVLQLIRGEDFKMGRLVNTVWRRGNKWILRDDRVKIMAYMQTPAVEKAGVAEALKLNAADLETASLVRSIFGETAEKGMFQRMGVRFDDWIDDYMPRMKEYIMTHAKDLPTDGKMSTFLKNAFGDHPPHQLDAFFKHQRIQDVIGLATDPDPLSVMHRYYKIGNRESLLGPVWKNIDDHMKSLGSKVNMEEWTRLNVYRADVMGMPQGFSDKLLRTVTQDFMSQMGIKKDVTTDLVKAMMGWSYLSFMGFRAWLPVRNALQIWTTLAPRFGNGVVARAVNKVVKDKSGKIFNQLREQGVITSRLPIFGSELIDTGTRMGKLTHWGLKWYKNSDEFTRAVAFSAASDKFDEAYKILRRSPITAISSEQFITRAGLWQLDPQRQNQVRALLRANEAKSARNLFAKIVTEQTMFPYRAGMTPMAFRSTPGKLFGMMGTYAVNYIENVRSALRYASPAQKMMFASRFVGNSMALYGAFKMIGVNAANFLPWTPAQFAGGPIYQVMNQTLQAFDFRSYKGRQARGEMLGIKVKEGRLTFNPLQGELFKAFMPGNLLFKGIADGVDLMNEGEPYRAFLSVTSFPRIRSD